MLPFSRADFLSVFEAYNESVWPTQLVLLGVAVAAAATALRRGTTALRVSLALTGALWLWMAIAYHWTFFTRINPAAWIFGAAFALQAGLLWYAAARQTAPAEPARPGVRTIALFVIGYALVVYPLLTQLSDHAYPRAPTFGLPCPTTIFTFGVLVLTAHVTPRWLLVVPTLWALVGASAPFSFGVWEDLGLPVAAVVGVTVSVVQRRRR
jgi:hypothetical protein